MIITGTDSKNLMRLHTDSKHGESFEKTNLGRLPPEILLHILGYVVPDCNICFRQKYILKLGMVCKQLNEVVKSPELYRELVTVVRHPGVCLSGGSYRTRTFVSKSFFEKIIKNSGSCLRKITFGHTSWTKMILYSLRNRGDIIQEIIEEVITTKTIPKRLKKLSEINPTALSHLQFDTGFHRIGILEFTLAQKKSGESFYSRIVGLTVGVACTRSVIFLERMEKMATLIALAISSIPNLQKVKVWHRALNISIISDKFKNILENHDLLSIYQLSYSVESKREVDLGHRYFEKFVVKESDITWRRKSELPQPNPDEAFKKFLEWF